MSLQKGRDTVWSRSVTGNGQRLNVLDLEEAVDADSLTVAVQATNGIDCARIFEIRVY